MTWLADPQVWAAFLTLTALEVVLGIDNVIFISILAGKLPADQQARARRIGLLVAMGSRVLLLFSLAWIMRLTDPLFSIVGKDISGRDLILLIGGIFLIVKSTREIHERLEGDASHGSSGKAATFGSVILQIAILDVVFSLDSVITAVGMADKISIMVAAVTVAVVLMMVFAGAVSDFVHRHPTVKMLALSFLLLIGFTLVVEGFHVHIPKGYTYFAMAFSVFVELLNIRAGKKSKPVELREPRVG